MPKKKQEEDTKESKSNLKQLLNAIEKKYGEGTIIRVSDAVDSEKIPTGIFLIDVLLKGGLPKSSITTFYGGESTGKSLLAVIFAAKLTKEKQRIAIIDSEHSLSKAWLEQNGVDTEYAYFTQPDTYEKAIDIADILVRSKEFELVIFDSLTSAVPKEEVDKSAESQQMALQARLNSKLLKKLTSGLQPKNLADTETYNNTIIILIAQLREKVGCLYGNPEIIPGGHALKHNSHYILKFKSRAILKKKGENDPVGREISIKVEKAKYSRPLVQGITEFYFHPPKINNKKVFVDYAIQYGIVKRAGAWYTYEDIKEQGADKLFEALKGKPELLAKIKEEVINYDL